MGEITVYFVGICTHMQWPEDGLFGEVPGFRHRVVLVNGKAPHDILGMPIPRHLPTLRVATEDIIGVTSRGVPAPAEVTEWQLDGTQIEVVNGVGELVYDKSFECCVPHLKKLTPNLPPPSFHVVVQAEPEKASAYFEVKSGVMRAGLVSHGAAVSVLTIPTSEDVTKLRLTGFRGGETQDVLLRSGAQIAVSNVADSELDEDNDFLLHYETAEYIPSDAKVPTESAACCNPLDAPRQILGPHLNVGPGCSNSNFP